MSLEVKLGGFDMVFGLGNKRKKSEDEGHSGPQMSRREFFRQAKNAGISAAGAYVGMHVLGDMKAFAGEKYEGPPMALRLAEPDICIQMAWDALKTGNGHDQYKMNAKEFARSVLKLDGQGNVGMQFKKIDDITPKTSHGYYLLAAKLDNCGEYLIEKNLAGNPSLMLFANGLRNMFGRTSFDRNNYRAAEFFAKGLFVAGMYDKSYQEAVEEVMKFMKKNVREKELMLREIYENKFKKFSAMPKIRNVNTVEYKMLSFYWNLGFLALADERINKSGNRIGEQYHNPDSAYLQLYKKMNFHTYSNKL